MWLSVGLFLIFLVSEISGSQETKENDKEFLEVLSRIRDLKQNLIRHYHESYGPQGPKGPPGDVGFPGLRGYPGDKGQKGESLDAFLESCSNTVNFIDSKGERAENLE